MSAPWELSETFMRDFLDSAKAPPVFVERSVNRAGPGVGEQEYGRHGYLDRDCCTEAQDELIDVSNYAIFQWLKMYRDESRGMDSEEAHGIRADIAEATTHALIAWQLWERAKDRYEAVKP